MHAATLMRLRLSAAVIAAIVALPGLPGAGLSGWQGMAMAQPAGTAARLAELGLLLEALPGGAGARAVHGFQPARLGEAVPLLKEAGVVALDLSGTRTAGIEPLAELGGLVSLDLGNTPVTDLRPLRGLARLATGRRIAEYRRAATGTGADW